MIINNGYMQKYIMIILRTLDVYGLLWNILYF